MEKALFAAGCFWGVQEKFRRTVGVHDTQVGYTGGRTEKPTYEDVCAGLTGHAEAALVTFDPDIISYKKLLELFWDMHDPTTRNCQGPDVGEQYRSTIFFFDEEQERLARQSMEQLNRSGRFNSPVVTEIIRAGLFYPAEEYHQHYVEKMRNR